MTAIAEVPINKPTSTIHFIKTLKVRLTSNSTYFITKFTPEFSMSREIVSLSAWPRTKPIQSATCTQVNGLNTFVYTIYSKVLILNNEINHWHDNNIKINSRQVLL